MRKNLSIKLNVIPESNEGVAITTSEGAPLSYIYDDTWDFGGIQKFAIGRPRKVSFKKSNKDYLKAVQSTLADICFRCKEKEKTFPTRSQVEAWKLGLFYIAESLNGCDWGALSDDHVYKNFKRKLKKVFKSKGLSVTTQKNVMTSLNNLSKHGYCNRKFDYKDLRETSNSKGTKQHIASPIGLYRSILSNAIETIETYHPHRKNINRVMEEIWSIDEKLHKEEANTYSKNAINNHIRDKCKNIKHKIPDIVLDRSGEGLREVIYQCIIVVIAFSGVRIGELKSFTKDSYTVVKTVNGNDISVLKGETSKGSAGLPVTETWQTHSIVKDALELAYDASECYRKKYKKEVTLNYESGELSKDDYDSAIREIRSAFLNVGPSKKTKFFVVSAIDKRLNQIIKKLDLMATQTDVDEFERMNPTRIGELKLGGTLPKLTPHDFRRNFAVFFKRYGFGTSTSIKFQYKHKNINMSDYYSNNAALQAMEDILLDSELLDIFNEEGVQMGVDIFDEIYNKSSKLSGEAGKQITIDKFQKLKDGHQVYMERDEIYVLVRQGDLSVVKLPTGGYCLNATCSRVCGIGAFAAEIKPCVHKVITDNEAKNIARQNKRLIKSFREMNTGDSMMQSILISQKQKIKINEILLKQHGLKFEEFNDACHGAIEMQEV
jgi:hypothetical protein